MVEGITTGLVNAADQIDTARTDLIGTVGLTESGEGTAADVSGVTAGIDGEKGTMKFTMQVMEAERKIDETAAVVTGIAQGNKTGNQKLANNIG